MRQIALRSNSQNNIKKWDLVSNDEFQLQLARHFRTKRLFYERRRREWSERRTHFKSVGVRHGPEIKHLAQLIASYHWDDRILGPVAAKKPAELFEGKEYNRIAEIPPEAAYQLFLLDQVVDAHVKALSEVRQYVENLAGHMSHALLALIVRTLQSANVKLGSDEFTKLIEAEAKNQSGKWRKFVLSAINCIRSHYRGEDRRYRRTAKKPLTAVNFFKSRTMVGKIFSGSVPRTLTASARVALFRK